MRAARIGAALAVLAAGAVHLYLWAADDYRSIHAIGPLFLVNVITAVVIGVALLVTGAALVVLLGIGYAGATLTAFVVSATSGLFGWKETWSGSAQAVAGLAELAAVVLLAALLAVPEHEAEPRVG